MHTAAMVKVYSYARWSSPEQAKGDSFRRQTDAAALWASKRGFTLDVALSFRDEGVSAYRGTNSDEDSGLGRFLFACRRGLIEPGSYLLVESLDRISRMAPFDAQQIFGEIIRSGVTIATLNDGQEYTLERVRSDPMALILSLLVAWRGHEESATKGRRVAAAWEAKRAGLRAGSTKLFTRRAPAWLREEGGTLIVDEGRADIVRRIYAMTRAGIGEHSIARALNDDGVRPVGRAKQWHRSTVSKFLTTPAVIGTFTPGRLDYSTGKKRRVSETPIPNVFPAIISEADWYAVRAMKDGSAASVRGRHAAKGVTHLLGGLARCPLCAGTMVRVMKGNAAKAGRPKLVCSAAKTGTGCSYKSVPVHAVEDALLRDWGALLESIPAGDANAGLDRHHADLAASIAGTEEHLTALADALDAAPSATGAIRVHRVEAELRTMRADLEALDERRAIADGGLLRTRLGDLADLFDAGTADGGTLDRAAINAGLKSLFTGATVDYRTGHVRLHWRQGGEASVVYAFPADAA